MPDASDLSPKDRLKISAGLRILGTSDLHMHLSSHDFYRDAPDASVGLTRTASLIRQARQQADTNQRTCLLFDNGDGLQGTPMEDRSTAPIDDPHPLMKCFSALNYDCLGLGNHDFDFGAETLARVLQDAPCPVVCSNIEWSRPPADLTVQSNAILEREVICSDGTLRSIRIGLLSLLPPQTLKWNGHILKGRMIIRDMISAARIHIDSLRNQGADIVIALAHTGLGDARVAGGMENCLIPLANLEGINAIIAGHTHLPYPVANHEVELPIPVVLPGFAGSHLGVIDLDLQWQAATGWFVQDSHAGLRPIRDIAGQQSSTEPVSEDPALRRCLETDHARTRAQMDQAIGQTDIALHSYFSLFGPDPAGRLVADAMRDWCRAHSPDTELPILAAVAPGKSGGRAGPGYYTDIPVGPLRLRHVADLYVYPNQIRAVEVAGSDIRDWLEMSAGVFNQISPGSVDQALINPIRAGHNFDVLHGLHYQIDLSQPARFTDAGDIADASSHRICDLTYDGVPVTDDRKFIVMTNSYRIMGGGSFPISAAPVLLDLPDFPVRRALLDYLSRGIDQGPTEACGGWRFCAMPGTCVTAISGSGAVAQLSNLSSVRIGSHSMTSDGFVHIPLHL